MILEATIEELYPAEDYCNVSVLSVRGRRPDGAKEKVYAINTGVLLRANDGSPEDATVTDPARE